MHVYELVTTTQGALRLLSASQAYSSVVRAELIDGRERKRQVGLETRAEENLRLDCCH